VKGKPITPEELEALSDEHKKKLVALRETLELKAQETIRIIRKDNEEYFQKFKELDDYTVQFSINHLVEVAKGKFSGEEKVNELIDVIQNDIVDNAGKFHGDIADEAPDSQWFNRYNINVLVDNSKLDGAPVVMESHPTYQNLFGRIEHRLVMGVSQTDFTMIHPGAMHRANGGYLLLPAREVLLNPYAWQGLERALRDGEIRILELGTQLGLISTVSLEPEPIPTLMTHHNPINKNFK